MDWKETLKKNRILILVLVGVFFLSIILIVSQMLSDKCPSIQKDCRDYIAEFRIKPCERDSDCVKTGYVCGVCECVNKNINLNMVKRFNLEFVREECYEKGYGLSCITIESLCRCIDGRCRFQV
jgi:hypothetical protein